MADWRHIQGKIRKARTSSDPPGQLAALYESTRDAMVAFELARLHEKNGSNADAATWYLTAAEKFRRAQWKTKAQEALVRLGVEVPLAITEASALASESVSPEQVQGEVMREISGTDKLFGRTEASSQYAEGTGEPDADADEGMDAPGESEGAGDIATSAVVEGASADGVAGDAAKKRRRRGRRGGRGRRKKVVGAPVSAVTAAAIPAESAADFVEPVDARTVDAQPVAAAMIPARAIPSRPSQQTGGRGSGRVSSQGRRGSSSSAPVARRDAERVAEPIVASEAEFADTSSGSIGPAAWQGRRRAGEPALASRLAGLESRLRRMLASPPSSLDDADKAPAGPGVFVLSDSELHDNYYVEACQTLRIGIGNLVRNGRTRNGDNIRGLLAEHLGITEPKVAKYLKDHCAIRWVQLDEEAQLLAHFAIAMLRPALND